MSARFGHWWVRHRWAAGLHRFVHPQGKATACFICSAVWADMLSCPATVEGIRRGEEDYAAGRWYRYDPATGISTPNPDWPKDGPQP